jgi:hypothetical protein
VPVVPPFYRDIENAVGRGKYYHPCPPLRFEIGGFQGGTLREGRFCYVIFNSHMFNAPRFNSEKDVSLQNFLL